MLDFKFESVKNEDCVAKVVLLDAFKNLDNERLVKKLGKNVIEELLTAAENENFKGEGGACLKTHIGGVPYVVLVCGEVSALKLGKVLYTAVKKYMNIEVVGAKVFDAEFVEKFVIGMENANYSFDKYCTKKKTEDFDRLETVNLDGFKTPDMEKVIAITNAVRYARDLGNEPANRLTPYEFVKDMERLNYLNLDIEVLDAEAMKRENFGLALAVAQGSVNPPYTVVLQWRGNPKKEDFDCGLVGKGVIYDSGGLSLKNATQMRSMKQDMSGAADVVSVLKAAALQKLPLNLVAVVSLVENMPSANAYKVDDILTSMSGQTVEVLNTDAEGRLALADSLWYIQKKYKVKTLIDIATLTGASQVVFGGLYAAVLGNDDKLIQKLIVSGKNVDENLWQLPMNKEYDKWLNSPVADMQNIGKRGMAGTATAAAFLQRFVHKSVKWAHLDIAGCECDEKTKVSTGFGVMLLHDFIFGLLK